MDGPDVGLLKEGESPVAKAKTKKQPVKAKSGKAKKSPKRPAKFRPMNVFVAPGSRAEKHYREMALPMAAVVQAISPKLPPTPQHNLITHAGKTLQTLVYTHI